jgi:hypothetical protein
MPKYIFIKINKHKKTPQLADSWRVKKGGEYPPRIMAYLPAGRCFALLAVMFLL